MCYCLMTFMWVSQSGGSSAGAALGKRSSRRRKKKKTGIRKIQLHGTFGRVCVVRPSPRSTRRGACACRVCVLRSPDFAGTQLHFHAAPVCSQVARLKKYRPSVQKEVHSLVWWRCGVSHLPPPLCTDCPGAGHSELQPSAVFLYCWKEKEREHKQVEATTLKTFLTTYLVVMPACKHQY